MWDLFTHEGRWGVQAVPALDELWGPLTGFKWLQHGSSVIGLAILAVWAIAVAASPAPGAPWRGSCRDAVRVGVVAVASGDPASRRGASVSSFYGPLTGRMDASQHLAYRVLPPACAVWGALTVALSIVVQVLRARTPSRGRTSQRHSAASRPQRRGGLNPVGPPS